MKLNIKKLLKNDSVINSYLIYFLIDLFFLVLNLGFGITVTKRKIYHERNYFIANLEVAILFITLLVAIIRFFWLYKKIHSGKKVSARVNGMSVLENESFWKKRKENSLQLSFEMDGANFEKEVPVKYSSDLKKILEKGTTTILVRDSWAEKILLLELFADVDS